MRVYEDVEKGTLQPLGVVGVINETLLSKEVEVSLKDKSSVNGIVREVNGVHIILSKVDDWGDKVKLFVKNIQDLKSSEHPYYTMEHRRSLRMQKIPRPDFRYERQELEDLIGKFAFVNYDGKLIDGEIVSFEFVSKNENSVTIKSDSEYKTIENYRLRDFEVTSDNKQGHKLVKKLRQLETDLFVDLEERFTSGDADSLKDKKVEPEDLIDSYFIEKIGEVRGNVADFSEFSYLWTQEIFDEYEENGSLDSSLNDLLKKAREVNSYYKSRVDFVDFVVNKVRSTDWTEYFTTQKDGEVQALEYLYEMELVLQ